MTPISINDLDHNLREDVEGSTNVQAYEAPYEGATVSNQCWHIAFCPDAFRGGIVFVGSGSSGYMSWTDAGCAEEVLRRYLADEMVG